MLDIIIQPGIGLENLKFGFNRQQVEAILGPPDERDQIEAEDELLEQAMVWHYWDLYLSVFFGGEKQNTVVAFETDHLNAILFDQKVFKLSENQIIEMVKEKKLYDFEREVEEWGETRLTFHDLGMDFYFNDKKLETINWSAWYDQNGVMVIPERSL